MDTKRILARLAVSALVVASAAVAAAGPVGAAPAPAGKVSTVVQPLCSLHPGLRADRSPVPIRQSPGYTTIVGWGNSCDNISAGAWTNNAAVTCNDGNVSIAWVYVSDFSVGVAGWIS